MNMRIIDLNGSNFDDMDSFYDEVTNVFSPSAINGKNLDALQDLLWGGMGIHEFEQPLTIHWLNSKKSRKDFGYFKFKKLINVMQQVPHIEVILK